MMWGPNKVMRAVNLWRAVGPDQAASIMGGDWSENVPLMQGYGVDAIGNVCMNNPMKKLLSDNCLTPEMVNVLVMETEAGFVAEINSDEFSITSATYADEETLMAELEEAGIFDVERQSDMDAL